MERYGGMMCGGAFYKITGKCNGYCFGSKLNFEPEDGWRPGDGNDLSDTQGGSLTYCGPDINDTGNPVTHFPLIPGEGYTTAPPWTYRRLRVHMYIKFTFSLSDTVLKYCTEDALRKRLLKLCRSYSFKVSHIGRS